MKKISPMALFGMGLCVAVVIFAFMQEAASPARAKFYEGQYVKLTVADTVGMIIDTTCWSGRDAVCWYVVRFPEPAGRMNNVREYELEAVAR